MNENNTTITEVKEWPGAFGIFKTSREVIRANLGTFVLLWLALFGANLVVGLLFGMHSTGALFIREIVNYFVGAYVGIALVVLCLKGIQRKKVDLNALLPMVNPLFWRMFLLELLITVSVVGGLILLIVPGIIIGMRLSLAAYFLADKNLSVMEAYKASWHATKGHLGKMWGIFGVVILMILPSITIIGVVLTVYWLFMYSAVTALLYVYLTQKSEAR